MRYFIIKPPRIYHNIRCPHRLRHAQRVSDGTMTKTTTNHPGTRQKRAC
ncbi:hypothetical protein Y683_004779 [Salmonella enterica subsp. enterica]|nr:hypothetical protein [Salmonella enterica subsp. enterica]